MGKLTDEQLRRIEDHLEGRLSREESSRLEAWLKTSPPGRDYLAFLQGLPKASSSARRQSPPANLTDRVMEHVTARGGVPRRTLSWPQLRLAFACMVLMALGGGWWLVSQHKQPQAELTLDAPGAKRVEVAGDFTGWREFPLQKRDGFWRIKVPVRAGQDYQYVFLLNGRTLVIDPENERVLKDPKGDLYSVLRVGDTIKGGKDMMQTTERGLRGAGLALGLWLTAFSPAAAYADTRPAFMAGIQKDAKAASLSPAETRSLLDQARQASQKGVPDQVLEDVVQGALAIGKGRAARKALERCGLLVVEGLAPVEAGKAVLKEAKAEEKARDEEMEKALAPGLKGSKAPAQNGPALLTQAQVEEKLEEKRQEWEERMEKQQQIQSLQHNFIER